MSAYLASLRLRANWATTLAAMVLVLAGCWAYRNSLSTPFFFDDVPGIVDNRSIRHFRAIAAVLSPPMNDGTGVAGRPLVNLSLAINYALGGLQVSGYHVTNLAIHLLVGLTLFGLVRRTLQRRGTEPSIAIAWLVAVIWTLHPLLTESVTCVVQRTESMMGLFYLLTLYGFVRARDARDLRRSRQWDTLSITACILGMATKEVMVTAPLIVWLYDRTFVAGGFATAWRMRWRYYLGLGASWLLLAYLVVHAGGRRGGAAGFGLGVTAWTYGLTQAEALVLYLKLAAWPHPLVVDYGRNINLDTVAVASSLAFLALLLAVSGYALFRREPPGASLRRRNWRAFGFLGAWFFIILAPSSSFLPLVTQTMAEHRMYLPLAGLVTLAVLGLRAALGRATLFIGLALAVGLGVLTARRNDDYASVQSIWQDTVAKRPTNARAHNNLALELAKSPAHFDQAIAHYDKALRLEPDYAEAHNNLAILLDNSGQAAQAIDQYRQALACRPRYPKALEGLAVALGRNGQTADATKAFERALQLDPDYAEAHYNYAATLARIPGRGLQAIQEYKAALGIDDDYIDAHYNLANLLAETPGSVPEAIQHYEATLRLAPNYAEAHNNLANVLSVIPGRLPDAIQHYETALRLQPDYPEAHNNLAIACANTGQIDLAITHFKMALKFDPNFAGARENLRQLQEAK